MATYTNTDALKAIYSLCYPETSRTIDDLTDVYPHEIYDSVWNKETERYDRNFLNTWSKWVSPVFSFEPKHFYGYVSAGSSEAIRETLAQYKAFAGDKARIHVFDGEYEGFYRYAKCYNIEVLTHDRNNYEISLKGLNIRDTELFFISQPSAIDGNIWEGLDDFLIYVGRNFSKLKIYLDVAYVGTCVKDSKIDIQNPLIDTVFFSLSKPFGVYYHRIGGVFSRSPINGLEGNQWFHNKFSLLLGITLMERYKVNELPKKYIHLQEEAVKILKEKIITNITASDCLLIANSSTTAEKEFRRTYKNNRYCLTNIIHSLLPRG